MSSISKLSFTSLFVVCLLISKQALSVTNYDAVCDSVTPCGGSCTSCEEPNEFSPASNKDCIACSLIDDCSACSNDIGCNTCDLGSDYDACVLSTNSCGLKVCKCIDIDSKMSEMVQFFDELAAGAGLSELTLDLDSMFASDFSVCLDIVECGDISLLTSFSTFCDVAGTCGFDSYYSGDFNVVYDFRGTCHNSVIGMFNIDATGSIEWNEDGLATRIVHNYKNSETKTKIQQYLDSL